jgi:hypothetical protein
MRDFTAHYAAELSLEGLSRVFLTSQNAAQLFFGCLAATPGMAASGWAWKRLAARQLFACRTWTGPLPLAAATPPAQPSLQPHHAERRGITEESFLDAS